MQNIAQEKEGITMSNKYPFTIKCIEYKHKYPTTLYVPIFDNDPEHGILSEFFMEMGSFKRNIQECLQSNMDFGGNAIVMCFVGDDMLEISGNIDDANIDESIRISKADLIELINEVDEAISKCKKLCHKTG